MIYSQLPIATSNPTSHCTTESPNRVTVASSEKKGDTVSKDTPLIFKRMGREGKGGGGSRLACPLTSLDFQYFLVVTNSHACMFEPFCVYFSLLRRERERVVFCENEGQADKQKVLRQTDRNKEREDKQTDREMVWSGWGQLVNLILMQSWIVCGILGHLAYTAYSFRLLS